MVDAMITAVAAVEVDTPATVTMIVAMGDVTITADVVVTATAETATADLVTIATEIAEVTAVAAAAVVAVATTVLLAARRQMLLAMELTLELATLLLHARMMTVVVMTDWLIETKRLQVY